MLSCTSSLAPQKQYIFAVHPHGIHCWALGAFACTGGQFAQKYPGLSCRGIAASVIFFIPLVREIFLWLGYRDARRSSAERILREKHSLFVCTGGEAESLEVCHVAALLGHFLRALLCVVYIPDGAWPRYCVPPRPAGLCEVRMRDTS